MDAAEINSKFLWPYAHQLPVRQRGTSLYRKSDGLLAALEAMVEDRRAWPPIPGSTKRTEPEAKLQDWLAAQNAQRRRFDSVHGTSFGVSLQLENLPPDRGGNGKRVISTSRNIAYIVTKCDDFTAAIGTAFGAECRELAARVMHPDLGVFVYVSNSIESGGRAFSGDPFTGQVAAYSRIFAHDLLGDKVMSFVCYYPNQLYSQFFAATGGVPDNKGVRVLRAHATLIITCGGVLISPPEWSILGGPRP